MRILADLHNHSCLSPCGSLDLSPSVLARKARERGIGLLALTDHNSALNCAAFGQACRREGLIPLFGIEACSVEEVHILCIFGTEGEALDFGRSLRDILPDLPYDPEKLGDQVVVDVDENVLDLPDYYLGAALSASFDELCAAAGAAGALVIPAHVDRPMFSVGSQLGFLPPGAYAAVESMRKPELRLCLDLPVISGSDAHHPEHVGRRPFLMETDIPLDSGSDGRRVLAALGSALTARDIWPSWEIQSWRAGGR